MQNVIKIRFCQNLSKFQDRTEESRRENGASGEDSQPLRYIFLTCKQYIASNHNLHHNTDGISNLIPSFFVSLFTLSFSKITLKLSKFCQNFYEPFLSKKWFFLCFFALFMGFKGE